VANGDEISESKREETIHYLVRLAMEQNQIPQTSHNALRLMEVLYDLWVDERTILPFKDDWLWTLGTEIQARRAVQDEE
jgi:hypothetical protein